MDMFRDYGLPYVDEDDQGYGDAMARLRAMREWYARAQEMEAPQTRAMPISSGLPEAYQMSEDTWVPPSGLLQRPRIKWPSQSPPLVSPLDAPEPYMDADDQGEYGQGPEEPQVYDPAFRDAWYNAEPYRRTLRDARGALSRPSDTLPMTVWKP